jgi:hypothetical protein
LLRAQVTVSLPISPLSRSISFIIASATDFAFRVPLDLRNVPAIHEFFGREDELQRLWNGLGPNSSPLRKVATLGGLGGIGKTQLAIRFARTHKEDYSAIFWINSEDQGTIIRSLAYAFSKIPETKCKEACQSQQRSQPDNITGQKEVDRNAEAMLNWLALDGNSAWLLVFDNAVDDYCDQDPHSSGSVHDISHYFPAADHGSILITSRSSRLRELGMHYPVQKLDPTDAVQLLLFSAGCKQHKQEETANPGTPPIRAAVLLMLIQFAQKSSFWPGN